MANFVYHSQNLLVVLLTFLSFCVVADERVILGSVERQTEEGEYFGLTLESISNGVGVQFLNFVDSGFYFGAEFSRLTGDSEACVRSQCVSSDTDFNHTMFSGEFGRNFGDWTPFVGASYNETESDGESVDGWGLDVGSWLSFDSFKLKGTITNADDEISRGISGGFLFQMDNNWALGAEIGTLLDSESDVINFSLQLGWVF
ncbi:MAG: hypothetical protein F4W92_09070 [Gammaproteobacteria bacterium]|nr:hypothetical protein [Gammaproteobacteria bacterium]